MVQRLKKACHNGIGFIKNNLGKQGWVRDLIMSFLSLMKFYNLK